MKSLRLQTRGWGEEEAKVKEKVGKREYRGRRTAVRKQEGKVGKTEQDGTRANGTADEEWFARGKTRSRGTRDHHIDVPLRKTYFSSVSLPQESSATLWTTERGMSPMSWSEERMINELYDGGQNVMNYKTRNYRPCFKRQNGDLSVIL